MNGVSEGLIIGTTVGVVIGVLLAVGILLCMRYRRSQAQIRSSSSRRSSTIPMRANGVNTCAELSNSTTGQESPREFEDRGPSLWIEGPGRKSLISASGIPKYAYKELQKATSNFTKLLGQGAFGPVYKADMSSGEILAVKVLANNSKQGEKEFQNEVLLLGRLHHRNLVNLVGYCAEKGQHILLYAYMPNGSLASHLYGENSAPLRWELRVNIALDVARGLEYLHDGAVPPVVHRDIKSPNILLDQSMHARVADFGLSREEMLTRNGANIRGTFGYLDPEYVSSRSFTKKSDVYSYGVLLFELIAGRNPQQGLMEYVELAAINADGKTGWEEIADSRLEGAFDVEELNDMAAAAYKCVSRVSRKRPSMRDVVQALIRVAKHSHSSRNHHGRRLPPGRTDDESVDLEASEDQSSASGHQRQESVGSVSELPDV
ncbi:putative LRR receptor-like serine/threonine-protein kinase [Hordeum vulgare]|uniref:Protein kinase domain-containing protein n=1 Tax=Hordeum vulgare subsp. vulgare TaxID=112509 RepID=A0A8I6ZAX3_HORVV|nr:calcium/calmodulin-regulated receptor-like kinase 1 [Hordeum vulgare subsp. vulgare]XP_044956082.1 calcium/calmodulin-regulated receptor-like kinase 1 [Hordeum vulgare subsp. vulgare]KAE8805940.1 putative LRR receptor-like serine/threonine-protein kinase [Hordeum vulgare]